jgi:hypothetical protein
MSDDGELPEKYKLMLNEIDRLYKFYEQDNTVDNYKQALENVKNAQFMNYNLLQTGEYVSHGLTQLEVNQELDTLTDKRHTLHDRLLEHVCSNFKYLTTKFKPFIEKLVDDEHVDRGSLEHAVHSFAQFERGQMSENDAKNKGSQYMKQRFPIRPPNQPN